MSFRTLRFGDRTISYDAGLDIAGREESGVRPNKLISVDPQYDDDGIGTSDDETNSSDSSSAMKVCTADSEENLANAEENQPDKTPDPTLKPRRVIKPDLTAISRLLAFDEEEEDELQDSDSDETIPKPNSSHNSGWHKTIARDLAKLTSPISKDSGHRLARRHSITLCESRRHRRISTTISSPTTSGSACHQSHGPMSIQPHLKLAHQSSTASSVASETSSSCRSSPTRVEECSLNVNNFTLNPTLAESDSYENLSSGLKTLNLRLDEVAHIRSALTKAELEGIDSNLRDNIERGKVCFLCMKTKFGIFSRGQSCEMCKQVVCTKCQSKMRIPLEHFCATPVFALSPLTATEEAQRRSSGDQPLKYSSMLTSASQCKEKKMSLAANLGILSLQSVGSAPNSPVLPRRNPEPDLTSSGLPTISGVVGFANNSQEPVSLPAAAAVITANPYATLPKSSRRLSLMSGRSVEREELEGVPLNVCNDCKDMVLQVIRVSRSARRLQVARSAFFSLGPDTFRDQRS